MADGLIQKAEIYSWLTQPTPTILRGKNVSAFNYGNRSNLYYGLHDTEVYIIRGTVGNSFVATIKKPRNPEHLFFATTAPKILTYGFLTIHPDPPIKLSDFTMDDIVEAFEKEGFKFQGRPSGQVKK